MTHTNSCGTGQSCREKVEMMLWGVPGNMSMAFYVLCKVFLQLKSDGTEGLHAQPLSLLSLEQV